MIWFDGQGSCPRGARRSDRWRARPSIAKKLGKGRFVWSAASEGKVAMTPARLAMLLEGIDWRMPSRTWRPLKTG